MKRNHWLSHLSPSLECFFWKWALLSFSLYILSILQVIGVIMFDKYLQDTLSYLYNFYFERFKCMSPLKIYYLLLNFHSQRILSGPTVTPPSVPPKMSRRTRFCHFIHCPVSSTYINVFICLFGVIWSLKHLSYPVKDKNVSIMAYYFIA